MNSEDTRNLFLAIALSVLVMAAWQYFYAGPLYQKQHQAQLQEQTQAAQQTPAAAATGAVKEVGVSPPGGAPAPGVDATVKNVPQALADNPRVAIDTPSVAGSIDLRGGKLDDLVLKDYRETISKQSPLIRLLSPSGAPDAYWTTTGYVGAGSVKTPTLDTLWTSDGKTLTPSQPVTLTWDNGEGLVFRRVISIDDKYMFTVADSVENTGAAPATVRPYGMVLRHGKPTVSGYSVLHEGFVGVIGDGGVQEVTYPNIEKATNRTDTWSGAGGWLGFTDKYWGTAIIPDQVEPIDARFTASGTVQPVDYQADFVGPEKVVAPGQTVATTTRVFAGAKEVSTIDNYGTKLGIKKFDLMIDWGWFYFITKPLFLLIDIIYKFVGNFGVAILIVTVLVKLAFFPLANRSFQSMAKMKKIQPQIAALKDTYPDDKMKQQQAQMELFKKEGVNPVAGCLPMVIQIPVFFALYKVIFITIEMRHAPFFGWIKDLSAPDPTNIFTLFGLIPWNPTALPVFGHFLALGIWPLIMGVSMFFQMKMNPEPADPVQKSMFAWMPVIFTFMLGTFPAGLVIYWTWNNTLTIAQQSLIMKRAGVKVELFDNVKKMFGFKTDTAATATPAKTPPAKTS
ncbi:YidC/Oxa1 family membrane protein insertase [Roseiarcus fermentans]|uniref:Membrane protein insertase YidC n=1 Tax=Roseiarcus fermentans TaxID=1473586 RepID=A0A366EVV5_9HYPH|nr:membrane protein insertase YidC [Roseiarcus fermentans]RBP06474.1 YidC/Oxa1 family membrane protein insertase [Roseiarcus fermentans]